MVAARCCSVAAPEPSAWSRLLSIHLDELAHPGPAPPQLPREVAAEVVQQMPKFATAIFNEVEAAAKHRAARGGLGAVLSWMASWCTSSAHGPRLAGAPRRAFNQLATQLLGAALEAQPVRSACLPHVPQLLALAFALGAHQHTELRTLELSLAMMLPVLQAAAQGEGVPSLLSGALLSQLLSSVSGKHPLCLVVLAWLLPHLSGEQQAQAMQLVPSWCAPEPQHRPALLKGLAALLQAAAASKPAATVVCAHAEAILGCTEQHQSQEPALEELVLGAARCIQASGGELQAVGLPIAEKMLGRRGWHAGLLLLGHLVDGSPSLPQATATLQVLQEASWQAPQLQWRAQATELLGRLLLSAPELQRSEAGLSAVQKQLQHPEPEVRLAVLAGLCSVASRTADTGCPAVVLFCQLSSSLMRMATADPFQQVQQACQLCLARGLWLLDTSTMDTITAAIAHVHHSGQEHFREGAFSASLQVLGAMAVHWGGQLRSLPEAVWGQLEELEGCCSISPQEAALATALLRKRQNPDDKEHDQSIQELVTPQEPPAPAQAPMEEAFMEVLLRCTQAVASGPVLEEEEGEGAARAVSSEDARVARIKAKLREEERREMEAEDSTVEQLRAQLQHERLRAREERVRSSHEAALRLIRREAELDLKALDRRVALLEAQELAAERQHQRALQALLPPEEEPLPKPVEKPAERERYQPRGARERATRGEGEQQQQQQRGGRGNKPSEDEHKAATGVLPFSSSGELPPPLEAPPRGGQHTRQKQPQRTGRGKDH